MSDNCNSTNTNESDDDDQELLKQIDEPLVDDINSFTYENSNNSKITCTENNTQSNKLDSIRYSMCTLQESHSNDIDALLDELCNFSQNLNIYPQQQVIQQNTSNKKDTSILKDDSKTIDEQFEDVLKMISESLDAPISVNTSSPISNISSSTSPSNESYCGDGFNVFKSRNRANLLLAETKRNSSDSAFSDTPSLPSTLSLNLNPMHGRMQTTPRLNPVMSQSNTKECLNQINEIDDKAEKIRIALEKLKEANIKKLIVKAYTDDGCTKSILIDQTMQSYDITLTFLGKMHVIPTVKHCIIESLPKLHMERIIEDHEILVDVMSHWTRDSENKILFTERTSKYEMFLKPELYLMNGMTAKLDESTRTKLLNELFQNESPPVPDLEGYLYFKVESKKTWKKYYCLLRHSGLYYVPKGKQKKDMQCLFNFDKLDIFNAVDWKREYKAPSDYCFALKHQSIQILKTSVKQIKYICCESYNDYKLWFNGIRIAKFGKQLFDNYRRVNNLAEECKIHGFKALDANRRLSTQLSHSKRSSSIQRLNSKSVDNLNSTATTTQLECLSIDISSQYYKKDENILHASKLVQKVPQAQLPIKSNNEVTTLLNKLKPTKSYEQQTPITRKLSDNSIYKHDEKTFSFRKNSLEILSDINDILDLPAPPAELLIQENADPDSPLPSPPIPLILTRSTSPMIKTPKQQNFYEVKKPSSYEERPTVISELSIALNKQRKIVEPNIEIVSSSYTKRPPLPPRSETTRLSSN